MNKTNKIVDHELKTWPIYFEGTLSDRKSFEYRKDDRGFRTGDTLFLREFSNNPHKDKRYTGRNMRLLVKEICNFSPFLKWKFFI